MMAQVVPIDSVKADCRAAFFVTKMKTVLLKQGQIEPLQINKKTNTMHSCDVHGHTIWFAAKELGWDTLLVVFNERYEE